MRLSSESRLFNTGPQLTNHKPGLKKKKDAGVQTFPFAISKYLTILNNDRVLVYGIAELCKIINSSPCFPPKQLAKHKIHQT